MGTPKHLVSAPRIGIPVLERDLVHPADLPLAQRIVSSRLQPLCLLVPVDVQVVLEQLDAGIDQHLLEYRRVVEEALSVIFATKSHDPLNAGAVVPRPIEQDEFSRGRQMLDIPLK